MNPSTHFLLHPVLPVSSRAASQDCPAGCHGVNESLVVLPESEVTPAWTGTNDVSPRASSHCPLRHRFAVWRTVPQDTHHSGCAGSSDSGIAGVPRGSSPGLSGSTTSNCTIMS